MTTGVNTPATLDLINTSQLELNEWTALSSLFQFNDADGDTVQGIRFEHSDNGTFAKDSTGNILAASTTHEFSSLNDILIGGHSNYAENTIRVQLYDGFEWNNWQEFDLTSGTNVTPEITAIVELDSATIRENTERALSEYISYYDDPNDDDNNLPTSVKVRTTGATGLGIEVDGVVTNLDDNAIEQSFTVNSLDDIFIIGDGDASNSAESIEIAVSDGFLWSEWTTLDITTVDNTPPTVISKTSTLDFSLADIVIEVKIENSELNLSSREKHTFYW